MKNSLPFARFTNLLRAAEDLQIPYNFFYQYRSDYHYILGQICLAEAEGRKINVTELLNCSILGSQPTANKRIKELIGFNLIAMETGEDKRQRLLCLTTKGHEHLEKCSEMMRFAFS